MAEGVELNDLLVFAAVVDSGGFTAAAERLGQNKARVSLVVRRLEAALGEALLVRTTRRVALTESGQRLIDEVLPPLRLAQEALLAQGRRGSGELSGTLRLGASVDHAVQSLAPAVARFAARHPGLQIELRTSDRVVDLVREGIDLSFRLGWLRDSSQRAVALGRFEQWVVAAPDHVRRAGRPKHPQDLAEHAWVALSLLPSPLTWSFAGRDGQTHSVRMHARLRTDSSASLRALLVSGAGVSVLDRWSAAGEVAAGRLERLLPAWALPSGGIFAVLPPGRHVAPAVRAFIDFYRGALNGAT